GFRFSMMFPHPSRAVQNQMLEVLACFISSLSLADSSFRASSSSWRAVLPLANGLNEPNKSSGEGTDGFASKPTLRRVSLINSTLETLSGQTSLAKPLSSHTVSFVLGLTDSLSALGTSLVFDFSERL